MQKTNENNKTAVLIVDDEPFNLELLEYSLEEDEDLILIRAMSATVALEIVHNQKVDLIISDISMPNMDGIEMLKILKSDEKYSYIPIIMVTAKHQERHEALRNGSEDFLLKPIDPLELKFKVTNLLKLKKYNDLQQHFNQILEQEIAKKEKQLKAFAQVEQELKIAKLIQDSILPRVYITDANLDVYGSCNQASEVGGDFFDIFQTEDGKYTVYVMADVSGHGFGSALVAMQFRSILRCELHKGDKPFGVSVEKINTTFSIENSNGSMFVTAIFMRYNHQTGVMESINAGHYDPIGNIQMKHSNGIPLGVMPDMSYEVLETLFAKGSKIILYTDGIIETENSKGEMYKEHFYQSCKASEHLSAQTQVQFLLEAFNGFIINQLDDVTLLSIQA